MYVCVCVCVGGITTNEKYRSKDDVTSAVVLAKLIAYLEDISKDTAPIFKLANLTKVYTTRMKQLGVGLDLRVHATRLKECLLAHFPDMQEYRKERDIYLVFKDDTGNALAKTCDYDIDSAVVSLARSKHINPSVVHSQINVKKTVSHNSY